MPVTNFLLLQAEKSGYNVLIQKTLVWRILTGHMETMKDQRVGISSSRTRHCLKRVVNHKNRTQDFFWNEARTKFLERGINIYYFITGVPVILVADTPVMIYSLGNPALPTLYTNSLILIDDFSSLPIPRISYHLTQFFPTMPRTCFVCFYHHFRISSI